MKSLFFEATDSQKKNLLENVIIFWFEIKFYCSNMWECLADAYLKRGSFNAALKSFVKVIELNPDSEYALYQ